VLHVPESVINVNGTTIMSDVPVITGRTVLENWPGIALRDKKEKTFLPIDSNCQKTVNFWLFKHTYKWQYEYRLLL